MGITSVGAIRWNVMRVPMLCFLSFLQQARLNIHTNRLHKYLLSGVHKALTLFNFVDCKDEFSSTLMNASCVSGCETSESTKYKDDRASIGSLQADISCVDGADNHLTLSHAWL